MLADTHAPSQRTTLTEQQGSMISSLAATLAWHPYEKSGIRQGQHREKIRTCCSPCKAGGGARNEQPIPAGKARQHLSFEGAPAHDRCEEWGRQKQMSLEGLLGGLWHHALLTACTLLHAAFPKYAHICTGWRAPIP